MAKYVAIVPYTDRDNKPCFRHIYISMGKEEIIKSRNESRDYRTLINMFLKKENTRVLFKFREDNDTNLVKRINNLVIDDEKITSLIQLEEALSQEPRLQRIKKEDFYELLEKYTFLLCKNFKTPLNP
jgi:hypothetical protein